MNQVLSFQVPPETRNRLETLAAKRGVTVQTLLARLVDQAISDASSPPAQEVVRDILRERRDELRGRGVARLWVFGSVARGDAGPESDVDMAVEFDPSARVSLTGFAHLRQELAEWLGHDVDLAEWRTLRPAVRDAAERDAVLVFE